MKLPILLLALLSSASLPAAITYSGIQNIPISNTFTSVYVDVDAVSTNSTPMTGWDLDAFFGGEALGNSTNFQPVRQTIAIDSAIVRLDLGDLVDGSDIYASADAGSDSHIGNAPDQFASGVTGYMGFRLVTNTSAGPYFGWMRLNLSNTGAPGNIIDWAYDDSGSGITVGAVPEPSSLSLAMLAAACLFRRRVNRA